MPRLRPNLSQSNTSTYSTSSSSPLPPPPPPPPPQFSFDDSNEEVLEDSNFSSARCVSLPPAPTRSSWYTCDSALRLFQPHSAQSANMHEGMRRMPHSDSV
nr:hypothetical protein HmN_000698200 [Hymenolepis microstoma]